MERIVFEELKIISHGTLKAINNLLLQLNANAKLLTKANLKEILTSSSNNLFIAKDSDTNMIVGMLTLIIYRIPFAKKGIIEDVVVDEKWRRKGIGEKLLNYTIEQARKEEIRHIDLTSNPTRKVGNKLYQRIGFEKRNTNVYRIRL